MQHLTSEKRIDMSSAVYHGMQSFWRVWSTETGSEFYVYADCFDDAIKAGREKDPTVHAGQRLL